MKILSKYLIQPPFNFDGQVDTGIMYLVKNIVSKIHSYFCVYIMKRLLFLLPPKSSECRMVRLPSFGKYSRTMPCICFQSRLLTLLTLVQADITFIAASGRILLKILASKCVILNFATKKICISVFKTKDMIKLF